MIDFASLARTAAAIVASSMLHALGQTAPPATTASWTPVGPNHTEYLFGSSPRPFATPTAGKVAALAVDHAGTLYAGAAGGGVWRRDAGGWTPLTDSLPWLTIGAIAIDPSSDSTIYVGTGQSASTPGYYGAGLYKSTDAGATWTQIVGPFLDPINATNTPTGSMGQNADGARIVSLAVSPTDPLVVLAGVEVGTNGLPESGIYRSRDGGLNWTPVLQGNVGYKVAFHPTDGSTAFADLGSGITSPASGLYRSNDGGISWTRLTTGLPSAGLGQAGLAVAPSDPRVLYAGFSDNVALGHLIGLYKSTDGGDSWARLASAPQYCAPFCNQPNNVIAVHPMHPDIVLLGGTETAVTRSLDGGVSFADISGSNPNAPHGDVTAFAFSASGDTLYMANDGGLAASSDFRATTPTWSFPQDNLAIAQFYSGFDVDRTDVNHAFAGTQDNGYQIFTGSLVWRSLGGWGDAGNILYEPSTDTPFIAGWTWACASYGCYVISPTHTGIPASEPTLQLPPIAVDPTSAAVQYTGGQHIYRTADSQASWTAISPMLATGPEVFTTIAVAAHAPNVVCAGTNLGHVWCTADAGNGVAASWSRRDSGLPARYVTKLSIYRFKEYVIAASFAGFSGVGDTLGHVFLSTDSGATWSDVSGNLPNSQVNDVLIDDPDRQFYAATDQGVFHTLDGGATWARVSTALPRAVATGLVMHRATRTLYASTFGRGVWRISAPILNATPPAATTLNPWRMRFRAHFGGPPPPPQSLDVINAGSPFFGVTPMRWTATAIPAFGGSWLSVSPASGVADAAVSVSVDVSALALGRYNGTVRIVDPAASNGPQDLLVMLEITDTAPVANAGTDFSVDATSSAGAVVTLDGTASSDPDGDKLAYAWTGTFGKAAGVRPQATLPIGTNVVTLIVTDPAGLTGTTHVNITVNGAAAQASALLSQLVAAVAAAPHANQAQVLIRMLQKALAANSDTELCRASGFFVAHARAFVGELVPDAQLTAFIAAARQIEAVLECK